MFRFSKLIMLIFVVMIFSTMQSQAITIQSEHPRLLLTPAEQSEYIPKYNSHPVWRRVEVNATNDYTANTEGYFDAACGGLYTTVTGDTTHVSRIVAALKNFKNYGSEDSWSYWGRSLRATAIAYDQAYNSMSVADRTECANSLLIEMQKAYNLYNNWDLSVLNNRGVQVTSGVIMGCLTIWEYLPDQDLFNWAFGMLKDIIAGQSLMGPNGGWYEGTGPYAEAVMTDSWMAMECLKRAANIDLITPNLELIRGTGNWVVQMHDNAHYVSCWDDASQGIFNYRNWNILAYAARLTNDPILSGWTDYFEELYNETMSITSGEIWRMLLFYDPALVSGDWSDMPLTYTSGINEDEFGIGLLTGRSDWEDDGVYFSFSVKDYFGHHGHVDNGSFTLSYGDKQIAIDAGYTSATPDGKDSQNHNTLLIPGSEPVGYKTHAGDLGSQIYYGYPEPRDSTELFKFQEDYHLGELTYVYNNNGIIYGCGDVSNAYRNGIRFFRHVMLLQPDVVLIYDDVDRANTFVMYAPEDANVQVDTNSFSYFGMNALCIGANQSVQVDPDYTIPIDNPYDANRISFTSDSGHAVIYAFGIEVPNVEMDFNNRAAGGKVVVDNKVYLISADTTAPANSNIGGFIEDEGDNPLQNVTVALSGDAVANTVTDVNGHYSFNVTEGDYKITPDLQGYISTPRNKSICGNYFDVDDLNFKMFIPSYRHVAGQITLSGGLSLAGQKVLLEGDDTSLSTTSDENGNFSFDVISGIYTITPEEDVYKFKPSVKTIEVAFSDINGIDFTASLINYFAVSGSILEGSAGLEGVVVSLSGDIEGNDTTGVDGKYQFNRIAEGSDITIQPTLIGYYFNPMTINLSNISSDVNDQDFQADTQFWGLVDFETGLKTPFSMELNLQGLTSWEVGDFGGKDNFELMSDASIGGGFKSSILVIPCIYEDVELEALYKPSECWEGPLALRVQENSDSYFMWAGSERDMLEIVYEKAGDRSFLIQKSQWDDGSTMDFTPNGWYFVDFKAEGQTLTASVQQLDNQYQPISGRFAEVSVDDNELTQGYVGTRSASLGTSVPYYLDNFKVSKSGASAVEDTYGQINNIPDSFVLEQNHPNPFNPTTTIEFSLPAGFGNKVKLNIYNVKGELVRELIDEEMSPGFHSIQWDATTQNNKTLASGIYIYELSVGQSMEFRKMLFIK